MPKMVPLVLQILIPNANRMCQVQGDVNGKLIEEQRVGLCYPMSSAWILKQKPATALLPLKSPSTHGTQSWAAGREVHRSFFFEQCLVIDSSLGVCRSRISGAQPGQSCCPSLAQGLTQTQPQESQGARFCHPPLSKAIRKGQAATRCKVPVNPLQSGLVKKHCWPLSCEQELLELLANLTMQSTWSDQWILLLYLFHKLPSGYDAVQITCCRCFVKKGISSTLHNNYL